MARKQRVLRGKIGDKRHNGAQRGLGIKRWQQRASARINVTRRGAASHRSFARQTKMNISSVSQRKYQPAAAWRQRRRNRRQRRQYG
jgi:hypothetical protein